MDRFAYKVAFVVATKDRPKELRTMLKSLARQSSLPDQIVIVDSSEDHNGSLPKEFPTLSINYIRYAGKPSASAQRNVGLSAVEKDMALIGFLDDDTEFEPYAMERMMTFWKSAPDDLGGATFNIVNHPSLSVSFLKTSLFAERLGLYSRKKGAVLPSGFHTMIGHVKAETFVEWLPTTAVIWRRSIFDVHRFDEWFEGYSYLEDLDFSYCVGKRHKLAVVADARYYHFPSDAGRINSYDFGKIEAKNRIYLVRKHGLSVTRCYLGITVRLLMSLSAACKSVNLSYVRRAMGNCVGLFQSLVREPDVSHKMRR